MFFLNQVFCLMSYKRDMSNAFVRYPSFFSIQIKSFFSSNILLSRSFLVCAYMAGLTSFCLICKADVPLPCCLSGYVIPLLSQLSGVRI